MDHLSTCFNLYAYRLLLHSPKFAHRSVRSNRITVIPANSFSGLPNLLSLYVDVHLITVLLLHNFSLHRRITNALVDLIRDENSSSAAKLYRVQIIYDFIISLISIRFTGYNSITYIAPNAFVNLGSSLQYL